MGNPYYGGPPSDHFDGERFFDRGRRGEKIRLVKLLRWRLSGHKAKWPRSAPSPYSDRPPERVQGLRIAMVGHATLLIQAAGCNILIDPHWSDRASPFLSFGPKRHNPPGIAFDDLPPIDVALVTHNHYDHLDTATLSRLWRVHRPMIVAPLGNDLVIRRADPAIEVATGDWGQRFALSPLVAATITPADHWSARGLSDHRMALWGGFAIEAPAGLIYLAGDTGYGDGSLFRAVRKKFGAPAVAILPIGAYEPRWLMAPQHVNPAEAVEIMRDCGAVQALGVHWGTFRLSDEAYDAPEKALSKALETHAIAPKRFIALRPGQVWRHRSS